MHVMVEIYGSEQLFSDSDETYCLSDNRHKNGKTRNELDDV